MIRVVLDTNVLVAALLNPVGAPAQVFVLVIGDADIQLCVSGPIFTEYEEVLHRPLFRRSGEEVESALRTIREKAFWVRPGQTVRACSDPDDDIFLECAQAADAHYLITGNAKHFPITWANIRTVNPRQFLDDLV